MRIHRWAQFKQELVVKQRAKLQTGRPLGGKTSRGGMLFGATVLETRVMVVWRSQTEGFTEQLSCHQSPIRHLDQES